MATVTKTLKLTGGDYDLMSDWNANEQTDLVSAGDTHVLECYDDWPSGLSDSVAIAGWTTDATHFITVKAATGEGHGGAVGTGFRITSSSTTTFGANQAYTVVEEIYAENTKVTGSCYVFRTIGDEVLYRRCIGVTYTDSGTGAAFYLSTGSASAYVYAENCLALSQTTRVADIPRGFFLYNHDYIIIRNCTAAGFHNNFDAPAGTNATVTNCVGYGATGSDFNLTSVTESYNASEDATAAGTGSITGLVSGDFTDTSLDDYSVSGTGSALYDAGTDLSGTFTDDITGATRSQWDIGAYEYISVGGATNPKGPLGHPLHGPFGGPL